jgi:glycosyltransferase involved in cell wall biosynthesis
VRIVLATTVAGSGGVWRHLLDVATGLRARGCEVEVALPEQAIELRRTADEADLPVGGLSPRSRSDIWHVHLADTYDRRTLGLILLARRTTGSVFLTEHLPRSDASDQTTRFSRPRSRLWSGGRSSIKTVFKRAEYACCHRVVCVSEASRRFVVERYGVPARKLVTIPNGVASPSDPSPWPGSPAPMFVAIGSVIVQKGFDVLVEAAGRARVPWSVCVVGDGPHRAALQARADTLGVPVHFVGSMADVRPALESASALVVPSRWEAWPYVAMEAMQAGRPVVATRVDGLPEIVVDGETGFLVGPDDADALAGALDRLAEDRTLAQALGRAGHHRVKTFGLERMLDDLVDQYEIALSAHGRSRRLDAGATA